MVKLIDKDLYAETIKKVIAKEITQNQHQKTDINHPRIILGENIK